VLNAGGRNAGFLGAFQAEGVRVVAEYDAQIEVEAARGNGVDERLQVSARPGDQDCRLTGHQT
jgi:hypothetical protein